MLIYPYITTDTKSVQETVEYNPAVVSTWVTIYTTIYNRDIW